MHPRSFGTSRRAHAFPLLRTIRRAGFLRSIGVIALGAAVATCNPDRGVGPGACTPNTLFFRVLPSSVTAGVALTPAVEVEVRDASGQVLACYTGQVTVALAANPGSATLSGTLTVTAVNGIATFANLVLNKTGSGYSFTASTAGVTSPTSAVITVNPAPAAKLIVTGQPANATAGASISPAVRITARDAFDNDAAFTGEVTLAITPGTGASGAVLNGTVRLNAVSGTATFTSVNITAAGTGYTLTATATGLTSAVTTAFNITAAAASRLIFTGQPGAQSPAGTAFAVTVTAQDPFGNKATSFVSNVTMALGNNAPGGTLTGTLVKTAVAGEATFDDLKINRVGAGYTLIAAATGLIGDASASFNIIPGAAAQLVFTTQPASARAGQALAAPGGVTITALDSEGNTATGFTGQVTMGITAGSGTAGATLSNAGPSAAAAGVVTFTGLAIDRVGTGYTLTATAGALSSSPSQGFNITSAPAAALFFTPGPVSSTAGVGFGATVTARDAFGNTATDFTAQVTLAIGNNAGGGTLAGTLQQAATAGVAAFTGLSIDKAGTGYTLTASSSPLTGATSAGFNIAAAAASQLVFSGQPTTSVSSAAIPAIVVTARDPFGNTATTFSGQVTLAIANNAGGGTLAGTTQRTAANGVATFPGLSIDKAGTGYTLGASAASLAGATSAAFDITPAAASQLAFTAQPANATAGQSIATVTVTARDPAGNTVTAFTDNVTMAIGTNPTGGSLGGTLQQAAVSGVATFAGLNIRTAGVGYQLLATSGSLTTPLSTAFTITPDVAASIVFSTQPSAARAGAAIGGVGGVKLTAKDQFNNDATGFTGQVTVALTPNTGTPGATLSNGGAVAAAAGVATFGNLQIDLVGSGYTLTATTSGLTAVNSAAFNITSAAATQLVFTTPPTSAVAGVPIPMTVTARDQFGNTATDFNGPVLLAITANPGGGTIIGPGFNPTSASSGVATFNGTAIDKVGQGYTLTASSGALTTATSGPFDISPAGAAVLVFTTGPASAVAGVNIPVTVTARDAFGNTATGFTTDVTLAIGTNPPGNAVLGGTTTVTPAAGTGAATFGVNITTAAQGYTLTATTQGVNPSTSAAFNITAAAASQLAFTTQPATSVSGVAIPTMAVTARDPFGNTATTFSGQVTLAIGPNPPNTGTLSGTAQRAAASGVASFPGLSIDKAGVGYTLTASATSLTGATSTAFDITPAAPSQLVFTSQPTSTTAGQSIATVTVTAQDPAGNTVPSFTDNVNIAIGTNPTGGSLGGTLQQAAVSGVATFAGLNIRTAGVGYQLLATSGSLTTPLSTAFTITPDAAAAIVFSTQPSAARAGEAISGGAGGVKVTAKDQFNNDVTSFTSQVTVALTAGTGTPGATLSNGGAVAAVAGVATFANLQLDLVGAGYTLTATTSGLTAVNSAAFNISSAPATALFITTQPVNATAGAGIPVTVTARDQFGNTASDFTSQVTLAFGANPGSGTLSGNTATASGGVATFAAMSVDKVGTGYTVVATAGALTSSASQGFDISPAAAAALFFTTQPANGTAGVNIPVTVTARDAFGNTATAFGAQVTLAFGNNAGGGTLTGGTATASNGVATFAGLSIDKSGTGYTLTASSSPLAGATSTAFNIVAAAASQLAFTTQPATSVSSVAIPDIVVTARDPFDNTATTFTGQVTLAISLPDPNGGTLAGTAQRAAASGVATFPGLSIDKAGGYTLSATATSLTGTTSAAFNITPAAPSQLVFTSQPTSTTAGQSIASVTVTAQDPAGNTVPTFTSNVNMAIGTNPTGGSLGGTLQQAAVGGVATFANLNIRTAGVGYQLLATSGALTTPLSGAFDITPGVAASLVYSTQPSAARAGEAISGPGGVRLTAKDQFNNDATGFTGQVAIAINTGPTMALQNNAPVAAVAGVATFPNLQIQLVGDYTLSATTGGLTAAISAAFNIRSAPAAAMFFTTQPGDATAGAGIPVALIARDQFGNQATDFAALVTLAFDNNAGGGTLSGNTATAANGTVTFAGVSVDKVGAGYTITASGGGVASGVSQGFDIGPAAAAALFFTTQPVDRTAGVAIPVTVEARDAFGNTATAFGGQVTLAFDNNAGPGTLTGGAATASSGVANFVSLSVDKVGTGYTLIASASAGALTSAASQGFNISPAAATKLAFTTQPPASTVSQVNMADIVVTARDQFDNDDTNFGGQVTLAITLPDPNGGTLTGTAQQAAASGVATFPGLSIDKAGGYTLRATSGILSAATSAAFNITHGTATHLGFTVNPGNAVAGDPIPGVGGTITVAVQDAANNTVLSATGDITLSFGTNPTGASLGGTLQRTVSAGLATFPSVNIQKAGIGYQLLATSGVLITPQPSAAFNIVAGPVSAAQSTVAAAPGTITASNGASQSTITVTAKDQFGNVIQSAPVSLAVTNSTGGNDVFTSPIPPTNASGETTSGYSATKAEQKTIRATIGAVIVTQTASVTVGPDVASELRFTNQPTAAVAGATINGGAGGIVVTAFDQFSNVATGLASNIVLAFNTSPASAAFTGITSVAPTAGVATFSVSVNKVGAYILDATSAPVAGAATSAGFNVSAAAPDRLLFTTPPVNSRAGNLIAGPTGVQVTVQDAFGNPATGSGNVTVAMAANPPTATLNGTKTVTPVNGVATFGDLTLNVVAAGYSMTATAPSLTGDISPAFDITPDVPNAAQSTVATTQTLIEACDVGCGTGGAPPTASLISVTLKDQFQHPIAGETVVFTVTASGGGTETFTAPALTDAAGMTATTYNGTFAELKTIQATAEGVSLTPLNVTVVPAAADVVTYIQPPTNAIAGGKMVPPVTAMVRDRFANEISTVGVTITATGPGTLSGGGPLGPSGGGSVVTFSNLSIDQPGGHTLTASAPGVTTPAVAPVNIGASVATRLVFTVQPVTTPTFTVMPTFTVTALDAAGNVATSFGASGELVTLTIAPQTGTPGAAILGTFIVNANNGVANFSGGGSPPMGIDSAGTGYQLLATGTGVPTGATSARFDITPAGVSSLAFTVPPTTATKLSAIQPAVQVTAFDFVGNVVTGFTGPVTLTIGTNGSTTGTAGTLTGPSCVAGSCTVNAVAGVATFPNLSIDQEGINYDLNATGGGTGTGSPSFDITATTANRLVFTTQPLGQVAGVGQQVVVEAQDGAGITLTGFTGPVTLAIVDGGNFAGAVPTLTVNAASGVATFPSVVIERVRAGGYRLVATPGAAKLKGATSSQFAISPAAATRLAFTQQPINRTVLQTNTVSLVALDPFGNTDVSYTTPVTVDLTLGTGTPGAAITSGPKMGTPAAGVVTIGNIGITTAGTNYALTATDGALSTTSGAFDVAAGAATRLVFTVQPSDAPAGSFVFPFVEVTALDVFDNVATTFGAPVDLVIGRNPSAGGTGTLIFGQPSTALAVGGVAVFNQLGNAVGFTAPGDGYTLLASSVPLGGPPVESVRVTVP